MEAETFETALDVIENAETWGTLNNYSSFKQSTIDVTSKMDDENSSTPKSSSQTLQCCKTNVIIHPFGPFRYTLDALIVVILIYTSIEVPIVIAFNINMSLSEPAGVIALCCDILLFIEIIINFRVAYFDRFDRLRLITNTYNIAIRYLTTWFIIDCLSCAPIEFFIGQTNNVFIKWLAFAKLLRLAKMMHILSRLSKQFTGRETKAFFKLFRLIAFMLLFAHFSACIWWYVGSITTDETTWIDAADLRGDNISTFDKYTYSWYWAVVTLFTTGYGDITATNTTEMWICSVCILIGTMFFSYFIGTLTMLITEGDKVKSYRTAKMEEAQHFCDIKKLPKELTRAVLTHTAYHCRYNFVFDEDEFISTLPPYLQLDILGKISNRKIRLKEIKAFKSLKDDILGKMSLKMRAVSCNKDKILFYKGSRAKNIYIQRTGTAVLDFHAQSKPKVTLQRGSVFGISALISPKRRATVHCKTWCECYVLSVADIVSILQTEYPETWRARWVKIINTVRETGDIDHLDLGFQTTKGTFQAPNAANGLSEFLHSPNTIHVHRYGNHSEKTLSTRSPSKEVSNVKKNTRVKNPFRLKAKSSYLRDSATKNEYKSDKKDIDALSAIIDHENWKQNHSNGRHTEFYMNNGRNEDDESDNVGDIAPGLNIIDDKFATKYKQKNKVRHQARARRGMGKMGGIRKGGKGIVVGKAKNVIKAVMMPPVKENVHLSPPTSDNAITFTPDSVEVPEIEMEEVLNEITNDDMHDLLDALRVVKKHDENQTSKSPTSTKEEFSRFEIIDDDESRKDKTLHSAISTPSDEVAYES